MHGVKQKTNLRKLVCGLLTVAVLLLAGALCACQQGTGMVQGDIVTQKMPDETRKPITVLVKYAFSINGFETAVEEKFPDIDLIQVGNYTGNMGIKEYESRLEHDDLPDVVMTWPLDVGSEYWESRLLDLSGFEFTGNYNLSMLNDISRDGKLYYLPGPAQVRGIVYNKTLFKENGWKIPNNFEEFVLLCKTIEAGGIRSLQLGLKNSEVLDTAFVGYGYADCFSQPQDTKWMRAYNEGTGSFGDHFKPALNTFQTLIDAGILKKSDLDVDYAERETMLFTRQCAMVEDSVLITRMGYSYAGTTDEFALMPFFNPGDGKDWARLYMVCYIGLNKHLAQPENRETYDLVMKLMEYISTPEGQEALMSDTGAMYSSVIGVPPPDVPEINALLPALQNGRYSIFPQLKNAQTALREGLAGMVRKELTSDDVIRMVDEQNAAPPVETAPTLLGKADTDFTILDTGNFVTDCMRTESGCEIALFLDNGKDGKYNGKGISARIYSGDVTSDDIARILPDLKRGEKGVLWKIEMTGENLRNTLEHTVSVNNNESGWFYYFSGLRMRYDVTAEPGQRIESITTADGKQIDPAKLYTIAVMDETVPDTFIASCEETDITMTKLLESAVQTQQTISPVSDDRFVVTQRKSEGNA